MKKRLTICIALLLLVTMLCLAGCSLFGDSVDDLANSAEKSSSGTKNVTTYNDLSKTELEEALTKYREIAESLSSRVSDLEEAVKQTISAAETNIGAYAVTYVDSVMSLTCSSPTNSELGSLSGTGFIITEDGYVITNNHVVCYEVADRTKPIRLYGDWGPIIGYEPKTGVYSSISAEFDSTSKYYQDGKVYALEFIYRDPSYDLALCKMVESVPAGTGTSWKAIPFYESDVVRGNEVLVLGNAYGFGLSATSGLVSATQKSFNDDYPNLTFIQTDAAINGGNSGGPAINIYGGLIGVVNSKLVSTNIENMGFAIELDKVKAFITAAETAKEITVSYKTIFAPQEAVAS